MARSVVKIILLISYIYNLFALHKGCREPSGYGIWLESVLPSPAHGHCTVTALCQDTDRFHSYSCLSIDMEWLTKTQINMTSQKIHWIVIPSQIFRSPANKDQPVTPAQQDSNLSRLLSGNSPTSDSDTSGIGSDISESALIDFMVRTFTSNFFFLICVWKGLCGSWKS